MKRKPKERRGTDSPLTIGDLLAAVSYCGGRADGSINAGDLLAALSSLANAKPAVRKKP